MTQIERLVKIYRDSRERLLLEIAKRKAAGRSVYHQEDMLALINQELKLLNADTAAWAQEAIPAAYLRGARSVQAALSPALRAGFSGLNRRAAAMLAHNAQDFLRITNGLIARQAQDTVRKIGVEVTARKFAQTLTVRETTKLMQQRLAEEGFMERVPWRDGRGYMRTDSYAELVARTTTAEATNTGTLDLMQELGQVLVKMSAHSTTCKVCAPRQGRVYRTVEAEQLPEGDARRQFPHIREGMPRWPTYKTVHPNCAHRLLPYVWDQKTADEQQAALAEAKKPFDLDPRGEAERLRYEKAQKENADRLRDRKEWEKLKAVFPDDTPSFSGYRNMKKTSSQRYLDLRADYQEVLKILRKEDILMDKFNTKLPVTGKPDSIKDLVREDGTVKQRRFYDSGGKVVKDIDTFDHDNKKHHPFGAHAHDWKNGKHGDPRELTEAEKRQNKDILERGDDE